MVGPAPGARGGLTSRQGETPSTAAISRGVTPSPLTSAAPLRVVIETSSSSASSQVAGVRERNALDYLLARTQLGVFTRGIVALWNDYDVLLPPGLAQRPVRIGEIDACSDEPWEDFRRSGQFTPYTAIFNVTGQPAISVPLFHGDDGLPTSIQLAGRPADEGTLLSLASQLEAARPWADRRPELAAV